jgi:dolichyl-phosphate beta-glucosyltransferase
MVRGGHERRGFSKRKNAGRGAGGGRGRPPHGYNCGLQSLSILIPAYNEEARLPSTLATLKGFLKGREFRFVEVVVIDDGSRDGTAKAVVEFGKSHPEFRLLSNPGNRGKGYAVRHGMQEARGEWVLFTDADLSAPIEEVDKLWAAVEKSGADGAIGSRALDRSLVGVRQPLVREFSGRVFNLHMRLVTGLPYIDTQCGFKLFSARACREVAARQRIERFGFDVEILYIARKRGLKVLEVPVRWDNVEGTKVSLRSGVTAFGDPWRVRWNDMKGLYG